MNRVTRRRFIQAAGATAGVAIATGYDPRAYAKNEQKVRVGCIGTGGQGNFHLGDGIWGTDEIDVVAVADVYEPHQKSGVLHAKLANAQMVLEGGKPTAEQRAILDKLPTPTAYYDYQEMIAQENLDAVVICTGLTHHYAPTMYALEQGLYVFCEKTLCYTIDEARDIVKKAHEKGRFVQVGHQRRYHPNYNLAMKRFLEEGWLGRINHIEMQWHRNAAGRRVIDPDYRFNEHERKFITTDLEHHLNWRLYEELSGGLFTELLTHSVDMANWFCGTLPTRVQCSAGTDYWRDGRTVADNISVTYDYTIKRSTGNFVPISSRNDYQDFKAINKPYTVRCMYSSILGNAKKGASELFLGDEGALELTEAHGCWFTQEPWARTLTPEEKKEKMAILAEFAELTKGMSIAEREAFKVTFGLSRKLSNAANEGATQFFAEGCEETADVHQFRAFAHHIKNGGTPRANEMVGLGATIVSVSALKAAKTGTPVDIDPAWMEFDFDTPSATDYDQEATAIEAEV